MGSYLLMRSKGMDTQRIEIDDERHCQDEHEPDRFSMFHKVQKEFEVKRPDGSPIMYSVAMRCPKSLTQKERAREFDWNVPMEEAERIVMAREREERKKNPKTKIDTDDMEVVFLLLTLISSIVG
jgi:hypothetical protein